jgi:hypothetical protein
MKDKVLLTSSNREAVIRKANLKYRIKVRNRIKVKVRKAFRNRAGSSQWFIIPSVIKKSGNQIYVIVVIKIK